jgi:DNA-binding MarR family transcriptional regulator
MSDISNLLDPKILKLLTVLYTNKSKLYHITQLASESKVSSATTIRLIDSLIKSNFVSVSVVGKLRIYSYNETEQNNTFMKVLNQ